MATQALKYTTNNDVVTLEALTPIGDILVDNLRIAITAFCNSVYEAVKLMPFANGGSKIIKDIATLAKDDKDKTLKFKPEDLQFAKGIAASMLDKEGTIFKLNNISPGISKHFKNSAPKIEISDEVKKSLEMFIDCFDFLLEQTLYNEEDE